MLTSIQPVDEGVLNMGALRISQGQVPYRDFFLFCTPFSFYLLAGVYKLFGATLLTGRVLALLLGILYVALTARLSSRVIDSSLFAAFPVAVLCQAGFGVWPFASHHWIANIFTILAILCAIKAMEEKTLLWSSLAGVCGAGVFWTLDDQGTFFITLVALLYLPLLPKGLRKTSFSGWIIGCAAGSIPFLAVLLPKIKLSTLWYDFFVFPFTGYKATPGNRYGVFFPLKEIALQWTSGAWRSSPLYTSIASFTSLVIYLLPAVAVILIVLSYFKKWDSVPRRGLLAAGALSLIATASRRWGPINLQWAAVLPSLVVAWSLWHWYQSSKNRRWIPAGIALFLVLTYGLFGLHSIGKVIAGDSMYPVKAAAGTLYTFNKRKAQILQETIDQIESRIPPGQPVLCKASPLINFMTRHPNPSYIDFFRPPGYTTDAQCRNVISDLNMRNTTWIVTPSFVPSENPFDRFLISNYDLAWNNGEYGLWRRKSTTGDPNG